MLTQQAVDKALSKVCKYNVGESLHLKAHVEMCQNNPRLSLPTCVVVERRVDHSASGWLVTYQCRVHVDPENASTPAFVLQPGSGALFMIFESELVNAEEARDLRASLSY